VWQLALFLHRRKNAIVVSMKEHNTAELPVRTGIFTIFMLGLLVLASVGIRLFFTRYQSVFNCWDSAWYVVIGRNIANGHGLTDFAGQAHTWFQPGYPFLIGLANRVIDDPIRAGRMVSCLFGSLALIPTFLLARLIYSHRVAYIAVILAAFHYRLIEASTDVLCEMSYAFFLILALFLTFRLAQDQRGILHYLLFGLAWAAACFVRTEGVLYTILALAYLQVHYLWRHGMNVRATAKLLMAAAVVCLALMPYVRFLHRETGQWILTGRETWALTADLETREVQWEHCDMKSYVRRCWPLLLKRTLFNIDYTLRKDIVTVLPPILIGLIAVGVFGRPWGRSRLSKELFLVGSLVVFVTVFPPLGFLPRYYCPYLFIAMIWAAKGVDNLHWWLEESYRGLGGPMWRFLVRDYKVLAVTILGIVFCLFFHKFSEPVRLGAYPASTASLADCEVGRWLRDSGIRGSRFLSVSPLVPYYAEGDQITCNLNLTPDDLKAFLRDKSIDYVVRDPRWDHYYPMLDVLGGAAVPPYLQLLEQPTGLKYSAGKSTVMVYRVIHEQLANRTR
jgi:hypothetical protein